MSQAAEALQTKTQNLQRGERRPGPESAFFHVRCVQISGISDTHEVDEREFILSELLEDTHDELKLVFIHHDAGGGTA